MKRINFKKLEVFTDITKRRKVTIDVRESLANLFYLKASGIMAHSIATRIYESDGEVEIDERELDFFLGVISGNCIPAIVDAVDLAMKE